MEQKIGLGAVVRWSSQAGGNWQTKEGTVVKVVQPKTDPCMLELARSLKARSNWGGGGWRDHESYVVSVPGGKTAKAKPVLYWPVASKLQVVKS